jgi:hypothetical protein
MQLHEGLSFSQQTVPFVKGAWKKMNQPHILCNCEVTAYPEFRHLGHYFMERCDYHDAPIRKVLRFIRSVILVKGRIRKGSKVDLEVRSARAS